MSSDALLLQFAADLRRLAAGWLLPRGVCPVFVFRLGAVQAVALDRAFACPLLVPPPLLAVHFVALDLADFRVADDVDLQLATPPPRHISFGSSVTLSKSLCAPSLGRSKS